MPTPLAQMTVCWHYTSKRGALLLSHTGNDKDAKWVPGRQCSIHHINRTTLIVTMPEWLAVKVGLMPMGALPFGDSNDKFTDRYTAGASSFG